MEEKFTLFYGGVFSNWYPSKFKDENGIIFNCAEQYMMYHKALTFKDLISATLIMQRDHPRDQKALGRQVHNFDAYEWSVISRDIVYKGLYYKFSQNPELKDALMATKGTTLVECSGTDKIWGIGFYETDPECRDRTKWQGTNWLGETLTKLRTDFETEKIK